MNAVACPIGLGGAAAGRGLSRRGLGAQLRSTPLAALAPAGSSRKCTSAAGLRRAQVVTAAAYSYVGKTDFSASKGKMGLISFGSAPKKANRNGIFIAISIVLGLPIVAAAALVHVTAAPVIAGPTAAALKGTYGITMAAVLLMYWASINVSIGRFKYKISPPATTGISEDFDRIFRVQENTIEQVAMFLPALWVFSFFVSPAIATGAGAVWLVGRVMYASGYYKKAAARGAGFGVSSLASNFLIAGASIGVLKSVLGM